MRKGSVQHLSSIEEEIRSLKDLGLSAEEKIVILEMLMISANTEEERARLQDAADAIAVDNILLGVDDE